MGKTVKLGNRLVGEGQPVYVIAEIGINHNGDIGIAKRMIRSAYAAGVDAVKFQKRTPAVCVPLSEQSKMRETPWGYMSYLSIGTCRIWEDEYHEIDELCRELGIDWFASVWDVESMILMKFDPLPTKSLPPV